MLFETKDTHSNLSNISFDFHPKYLSIDPDEINLMLMQTFYNYWFSEENIPFTSDYESLITTMTYFYERISNIESKSYNDIIRINTLYTNFSQNIFDLLSKSKMNQDDIIKLHRFLIDETFFSCFITVFLKVVKQDYETNFNRYFLALNKAFKNVFDEKDGIMFLFKKIFLDYLLIEYSHISEAEHKGGNKKILKDIERIMRRFLDMIADKRDKNYDDMKKGLINFFEDYEINLLQEEKEGKDENNEKKVKDSGTIENSQDKDKMLGKKRIRKRKIIKDKDESINEEDKEIEKNANLEKKKEGKQNEKTLQKEKEEDQKEDNKKTITKGRKKIVTKKGRRPKKEINDKELQVESDEEEDEDKEEEDIAVEENEEEEKKEIIKRRRGRKANPLKSSKSPKKEIKKSPLKRNETVKTSTNTQENIQTRRNSRFTEQNVTLNKTIKNKKQSPSSLSKYKSKGLKTRGRKPKEAIVSNTKEKTPIKNSPNKSSVTKRNYKVKKDIENDNNLIPIKTRQGSQKPKSILKKEKKGVSSATSPKSKKEKTPSPRKKRDKSQSNTPSPSPNKKKELNKKNSGNKFYHVLEAKYKRDKSKSKSPRKFNITPMKVNNKTKENELKKSSSKTKHKINFDEVLKPKYDFLNKKRNISFSADRYVKEFDPKTPVKEIVKRGVRMSPMDKKKKKAIKKKKK